MKTAKLLFDRNSVTPAIGVVIKVKKCEDLSTIM